MLPLHILSYPSFFFNCGFSFENQAKEDRFPLPDFVHLFWPPFWIFPSHVSLTCLTLEHSQAEKHQHTAPGFNLPLSLRLPVYVSLCPRLQLRPAPITIPHQHIYCTCLLAPCHPYTVLLHLVREQDGREEKKDKASQKIYRK